MPELEAVKQVLTASEQVIQCAWLPTAFQATLALSPKSPPPLEVTKGGQGLGACPDGPPHNPPQHPKDGGLPCQKMRNYSLIVNRTIGHAQS